VGMSDQQPTTQHTPTTQQVEEMLKPMWEQIRKLTHDVANLEKKLKAALEAPRRTPSGR
jgi:hypothetical protein